MQYNKRGVLLTQEIKQKFVRIIDYIQRCDNVLRQNLVEFCRKFDTYKTDLLIPCNDPVLQTLFMQFLSHHMMSHLLLNYTPFRNLISTGNNVGVKRSFAFDRNQYWVTEVTEELEAGSTVVLHLEFDGSLLNGIVGFYKSTYINTQTGVKR